MDFQGHLFVFMLCTLEYESSLSLSNPQRRRTPLRFRLSVCLKKENLKSKKGNCDFDACRLYNYKGAASIEYRGEHEATAVLSGV